jgi:uncharacterized repeat protein (TIGR03806 family)
VRGSLSAAAALLVACGGKHDAGTCVRPSDYASHPPEHLSEYCLLDNLAGAVVAKPGVVPYDVNTPLFSDYAIKTRLVWVPEGESIHYDADHAFDMPVGSLIAKSFAFAKDSRRPGADVRVIETRVLVRRATGWAGLPYIWSDDQKDATLRRDGATLPIDFVDLEGQPRHASYLVASDFDCHSCHDHADGFAYPIGVSARELNRDLEYPEGRENQLAHWSRRGILAGAPDPAEAPRLPVWSDPSTGTLEQRSRAYLDANCAHCHTPGGLALHTTLYLNWDQTDRESLGVCKPTEKSKPAFAGLHYDIVPGDPDRSVLPFRLASTDHDVAMPQIGRSVVHTEGLALIRAWIAGLPGSCETAAQDVSVVERSTSALEGPSEARVGPVEHVADFADAGAEDAGDARPDAGGHHDAR